MSTETPEDTKAKLREALSRGIANLKKTDVSEGSGERNWFEKPAPDEKPEEPIPPKGS